MKINLKYLKMAIFVLITIIIIVRIVYTLDNDLKIYFVDVGQGDCTVIVTPQKKNIVIDGGEGHNEKYDMGKNVVLPYLLDRGIKEIDFMMISHFDSDHVGGLFIILEEIKVKNVIISKQAEVGNYFRDFVEIASKKKINVISISCDKRIKIEDELYFHFLWPDDDNIIEENVLNNNSIVCKLIYNNFSMLFTGDIEKEAEDEIMDKYRNNTELLRADILKAAHHGSKTSSTEDFVDCVNPKIVLIGVGKKNKFGHPNDEVINRFKERGIKIYRTDLNGEVVVKVSKDGIIKKSSS